jgi:hypothetical protein
MYTRERSIPRFGAAALLVEGRLYYVGDAGIEVAGGDASSIESGARSGRAGGRARGREVAALGVGPSGMAGTKTQGRRSEMGGEMSRSMGEAAAVRLGRKPSRTSR